MTDYIDRLGNFKDAEGNVFLVRCPECKRENYCLEVVTGRCAFCGYDANQKGEPA